MLPCVYATAMGHYKTFLPFMEQTVRSQCYFDDEGRVRKKREAKELDEEAKVGGEGGEEGVRGGSLPGHVGAHRRAASRRWA
jgi:hypothetical protein